MTVKLSVNYFSLDSFKDVSLTSVSLLDSLWVLKFGFLL